MNTWEDVNKGLRRMGELAIKKAMAAAAYKEIVDKAQAEFDKVKGPADKQYEKLEAEIKSFATSRKDEFIGKKPDAKRTKKLSFGEVSFKLTPGAVEFDLSEELVIVNLKKLGHKDCVRVVEEIDKDAVKNIEPKDLLKAGIRVEKTDNCKVKPDIKKIQEEVAA